MKTITIATSSPYEVHIGKGLLNTIGALLKKLPKISRICIVSDRNVWPLWGSLLEKSIENAGFSLCSYIFPAGEEYKNAGTYLSLLNHLAENDITRSDCIVALGGGVVGDLAGFAAATYLRGIRYVQVPTTLLAAVDSSVGGKTAIDLPAGKNLAGAFCQPEMVICDTDTLSTLPEERFREGCAEVIKYAVLYDKGLFNLLKRDGLGFDLEAVITRCILLKARTVIADEFDRGERMKLNLGHTIGHSIEKRSQFAISHGAAVAMGMAIMARGTACADTDDIVSLLEQFGLPTHCGYSPDELYRNTLSDKKRCGDYVNLVIPRSIGSCDIVKCSYEELKSILQAGL